MGLRKSLAKPQSLGIETMAEKPQKGDDFNPRAATYETSRKQKIFFDRVQYQVLKLTDNQTPTAILDIGCGTGRLLRKAKTRWPNAQLVGIDPAQAMIERAKQLFPQGRFYVAMAATIPLPDSSIDLAFSTMSFHHWSDQNTAINEISRVLQPGGKFILADIVLPKGPSAVFRHYKRNDSKRIREAFSKAGLSVEIQKRKLTFVLLTMGQKSLVAN
jgi:ubiquinone/menaquinone biosynthesis C-methylase UbiE